MVQNGTLSVGELVAFLLYLNAFFQPIQQLVQQYNLYQQGQAAITKINELLTTASERRRRPTTPSRSRRSTAISCSPTCRSATTPRSPCCATSTSTSRQGRRCRSSVRPAPGSPPSPSSSPASTTPRGAASPSTATTSATSRIESLRTPARRRPPGAVPLRRQHARQHQVRQARRHRRRDLGGGAPRRAHRPRRPAPRGARHPGARTRRVARRRASASSSPSPAPSSPGPACSCSTRPRRTST